MNPSRFLRLPYNLGVHINVHKKYVLSNIDTDDIINKVVSSSKKY